MAEKHVVIVEDDRDMAELIALHLEREGYAVQTAHTGIEALALIQAQPPDLVILDLMLPGMSGTDVAIAVRRDARTAAISILMLTAKADETDMVIGLRSGADDYVTKPFSMPVLLARVAALLRRGQPVSDMDQGCLRAGPVLVDMARHAVEVAGQRVALTLTEFRLLAAIVAANGKVLTRNQLIDQGMGRDVVITDRTVDVHLTSLRRKLGKARHLIETVRGVGYRLGRTEGPVDASS